MINKTHIDSAQRRPSGPRALYRGKLRGAHTISVTFTPVGHEALARGQARTGLSRADYLERLTRADDAAHS